MKVSVKTQIAIFTLAVLLSAINLNAQNTAQTTEPQSKFVGEISALAQKAKVRRSLDYLKQIEPETVEEQIRITEIAAPTFKETKRGEYFRRRFTELGLQKVRVDAVRLHLGTIDDLDEKQYDAATALLVMHFLPDDGSKLNFLKAIHRRLKPGAKLIVADGCFDKNLKEFDWLLNAFISHAKLNGAPPEILNNTHKFIEESSPFITETRELELLAEANFGEIRSFFQGLWFRGWAMTRL